MVLMLADRARIDLCTVVLSQSAKHFPHGTAVLYSVMWLLPSSQRLSHWWARDPLLVPYIASEYQMLSFTPARAEQGAQHCSGAGPHPTEGLQSQLELSHKKPVPWDGEKLVLGGGQGQVQQHHLPPMNTRCTQRLLIYAWM